MKAKQMLCMLMAASLLLQPQATASEAKKASLAKKQITITVGKSKKISIKNKKKKAKYKFSSSKKKVAKVSSKGVIKGLKVGTAKITVKEKLKKKLRKVGIIVVKVKKVEKTEKGSMPTPAQTPKTTTLIATDPAVTPTPMSTSTATPTPTSTSATSPTPACNTQAPTPKATVPPEYDPPSDYTKRKSGVTYGTKKAITYYSTTTGKDRKANVVLPVGYDESKKYPVVYLLHGIGGDQNEWFSGKPIEILGNLNATEEADEMIMVFPNVRARENDAAVYELNVEHFQAFDNFINDLRDDLMPYMEANYSIKTGRENTAICGLSMGGRESLHIGLKMADKIGYIGAFEPAIGVLPYEIENGLFTTDTMTLPDEYKNNTFMMIVKGQNDTTVGEWPLTYHNTLTQNGVPHLYYDMPGGHDFTVWNNGWYNFAKRIFSKCSVKTELEG